MRRGRSDDRFVFAKTAIFFLGAGTWLAGVLLDDLRVTAVAIALLALGMLLRLISSRRSEPDANEETSEPPVS